MTHAGLALLFVSIAQSAVWQGVLAQDVQASVDEQPLRLHRSGQTPSTEAELQLAPQFEPEPAGQKQPYTLGASKIHVMTEQDQLQGGASGLRLTPQRAQVDVFAPQAAAAGAFPLRVDKNGLSASPDETALPGRGGSTVRLLADYDVELIVDSSLSMRKRDCPGGLSRWSWCGMQARDLGVQIAPFIPRGITITPFAGDYNVYPSASASNIADLFDNPNFRPGTRMAEPLQDRLQTFFRRRSPGSKPLLIAVITDGVPHPMYEPRFVAEVLIAASKQVKDPREVTVVFFQIGANDRFGKEFLNYLDKDLTKDGALHDLVQTVSFDHLMRIGLSQALADSISQFAVRTGSAQPPTAGAAPANVTAKQAVQAKKPIQAKKTVQIKKPQPIQKKKP